MVSGVVAIIMHQKSQRDISVSDFSHFIQWFSQCISLDHTFLPLIIVAGLLTGILGILD